MIHPIRSLVLAVQCAMSNGRIAALVVALIMMMMMIFVILIVVIVMVLARRLWFWLRLDLVMVLDDGAMVGVLLDNLGHVDLDVDAAENKLKNWIVNIIA